MKLKLFLLSYIVLWCSTVLSAKTLPNTFQLIPKPQNIEISDDKGLHFSELSYIYSINDAPIPILGPMIDRLPQMRKEGKGIHLHITKENVPASNEGYTITVHSQGIDISSNSNTGLFYGLQTLEQLMEDSRDFDVEIPSMKITDYPTIAYRAIHIDTKHHLNSMVSYYKAIDRLARYKINAIIWEIEDKLRFTRNPEIAAANAISKQEMQALCRYAAERNVEICPLVQGLGHAGFILKHHWELRETQSSDWEFCPSNPATYDMQFSLYDDALEAMPGGRYLHIGGDEISAIGICDRCKATGKTPFELQMDWLQKVCDYATSHGRTPIFWDDMPLKYGEVWDIVQGSDTEEVVAAAWNSEKLDWGIGLFPKECIYMRWNYNDATTPGHRRILQWYHEKGLTVMGATAASFGSSTFMPRGRSNVPNIKGFTELVAQNNLAGILSTAWDDGSPHDQTVWRGFVAQGEYGWNPTGRSIDEFFYAQSQREYGLTAEQMAFVEEMEQEANFFDGALVVSGHRTPAWGTTSFKLIDLPDPEHPGAWSMTYQDKIRQAKTEDTRYELISQAIKTASREALRNRYTLKVYEQTNNLFHYPVRLILALATYDQAHSEADRISALQNIHQVCDDFKTMRHDFETVYSQERFMQQPDGYISDQNRHNHLAAKSCNSDWWYYYELPMIHNVEDWIDKIRQSQLPD